MPRIPCNFRRTFFQAFINVNDKEQRDWFNKIKPRLKTPIFGLGHPSISCSFTKEGGVQNQEGQAYIGGELNFINNTWIIDNMSGRFGIIKNTPAETRILMKNIATQFENETGSSVHVRTYFPNSRYLKSYYKLWENRNSDIEGAIKLLEDYAKSHAAELFFTGHWFRHHASVVRNAVQNFKNNQNIKIEDILNYFADNLDPETINLKGSLMRRLNFIAGQNGVEFKLNDKKSSLKND